MMAEVVKGLMVVLAGEIVLPFVCGRVSPNGDTSEVGQVVQLKEPEPHRIALSAFNNPALIRADCHRTDLAAGGRVEPRS
jgi:hypothetical protein